MRSRRSSRPSWSSSALTLAAAGSLSTTPVAAAAPPPRVVVSCTVMFVSSTSEPGCPLERTNTAEPVSLPSGVSSDCLSLLYGARSEFPGLLPHTRRLLAREAPPARPPRPRRDDRRDQPGCLRRAHRSAGPGLRQGPADAEAQRGPGPAPRPTAPPPPPPTNRKEPYRRMREQQASGRVQSRRAAARGDDAYLPARDRGPVKKLVRDVVDARRNIGSMFLAIAAVALIGTVVPSLVVRSYASFVLFAFFLVLIVDSVVLGRRIKRAVAERFPDQADKTRGLIWYGISRSTMIRRWRFPKPGVPLGADV